MSPQSVRDIWSADLQSADQQPPRTDTQDDRTHPAKGRCEVLELAKAWEVGLKLLHTGVVHEHGSVHQLHIGCLAHGRNLICPFWCLQGHSRLSHHPCFMIATSARYPGRIKSQGNGRDIAAAEKHLMRAGPRSATQLRLQDFKLREASASKIVKDASPVERATRGSRFLPLTGLAKILLGGLTCERDPAKGYSSALSSLCQTGLRSVTTTTPL